MRKPKENHRSTIENLRKPVGKPSENQWKIMGKPRENHGKSIGKPPENMNLAFISHLFPEGKRERLSRQKGKREGGQTLISSLTRQE